MLAALAGACSLAACTLEHHAPLRAAELPPLAPQVLHSSRLWIQLGESTPDTQCVKPEAERLLCFEHVQGTFRQSLQRSLWTSYPEVSSSSGAVSADDYVLVVDLSLDALPPDASGPGWSAGARGKYRLLRGDKTLVAEGLVSRSRPEFAYGAPLGVGAAEAVQAIAARIGQDLGGVPESREIPPRPLPAVAVDAPSNAAAGTPGVRGKAPRVDRGVLQDQITIRNGEADPADSRPNGRLLSAR